MTAEDSDQEAGYAPSHHEGADNVVVCSEKVAKEDSSIEEKNRDLDERKRNYSSRFPSHIQSANLSANSLCANRFHSLTFRIVARLPGETTSTCFPKPNFASAKV